MSEMQVSKIVCRYDEAPSVKRYLSEGEDLILIAEVKRLRAALSSAAVAEREPVAWQHRVKSKYPEGQWSDWREGRANFSPAAMVEYEERPLYLDPPPTSELEAEFARLEREADNWLTLITAERQKTDVAEVRLSEAMKALDEVKGCFAAAYAEGLADRIAGASGYATGSLIDLVRRLLLPAFEAARRVREGGK